jgi:hypothetical protein
MPTREPADRPDPVFRGVENEPWAPYAGGGSGLRLITALLGRRKQRGNLPLPPVLPVIVATVALLVVLSGISFVIMLLWGR